jgi:hypothetical protein
MDYSIEVRVFDLGTKEGREEFFAANPWLVDDEQYSQFVIDSMATE